MGKAFSCCKGGVHATPAGDYRSRLKSHSKNSANNGGGMMSASSTAGILSGSTTMTGTFSSGTINGGLSHGAAPHQLYVIDTDHPHSHHLNHHHHMTGDGHHILDPRILSPLDEGSQVNLQHISEREMDDFHIDPSLNPVTGPLFIQKKRSNTTSTTKNELNAAGTSAGASGSRNRKVERRSYINLLERPMKKCSSCSTIYIDESTVSKPNLKTTIKCVSLAIYNLIRNRTGNRTIDIFDERLHPLTKENGYSSHVLLCREPDQRSIYRFIRNLFNASQLASECAIVTLVYLERLLTYAELDLGPVTWKRTVLGSIMLASKVWDDQAVWNVDYCQILKDVSVENMNELERNFLELIQFNIDVPTGVYAKYYFDLRSLADENDLTMPAQRLTVPMAEKLEAMSRTERTIFSDILHGTSVVHPNNGNNPPSAFSSTIHAILGRRWYSMEGGLEDQGSRSIAVLS